MRAFKALGNGKAEVKDGLPIPKLRPEYVTVQTIAVALNPTDWKHVGFLEDEATIGCDFAGIIEEVGSRVTKAWKKGDRVYGFVHGGNAIHGEDGAFGDYLTAKGDLIMRIPDEMSFEEAATVGVGIVTCGLGLYQSLELPFPDQPARESFPILIYGGSSATGMHGIQFAKASGLEVITTCSPRNFDLVKSLGADHVFDYSSPTCAADIKKVTNDKLLYAWDTIAEGDSPKICADALSSTGSPKYGSILRVKEFPREDINPLFILGYTAVGEEFKWRATIIPAKPEDFVFSSKFSSLAEKLLAAGTIKPHRKDLRTGGLDGIQQGLDDLRNGKVSGTKLVYQLSTEQGILAVQ